MSKIILNPISQEAALAACPIGLDVTAIVESSTTLRRALQKLRRDLIHCKSCPVGPKCLSWTGYQATVRQAIQIVAQEWRQ